MIQEHHHGGILSAGRRGLKPHHLKQISKIGWEMQSKDGLGSYHQLHQWIKSDGKGPQSDGIVEMDALRE